MSSSGGASDGEPTLLKGKKDVVGDSNEDSDSKEAKKLKKEVSEPIRHSTRQRKPTERLSMESFTDVSKKRKKKLKSSGLRNEKSVEKRKPTRTESRRIRKEAARDAGIEKKWNALASTLSLDQIVPAVFCTELRCTVSDDEISDEENINLNPDLPTMKELKKNMRNMVKDCGFGSDYNSIRLLDMPEGESEEDMDEFFCQQPYLDSVKIPSDAQVTEERFQEMMQEHRAQKRKRASYLKSLPADKHPSLYLGYHRKLQRLKPPRDKASFDDGISFEKLKMSYERKMKKIKKNHRDVTYQDSSIASKSAEAKPLASTTAPSPRKKTEEDIRKDIWSHICRREIPRMQKQMATIKSTVVSNYKRLSQLCHKEVRKHALKSLKASREMPLRSKRMMKEMLVYWKKHEKEERELRKKAERDFEEKRKKEEELREAKRQQRKLNFLITQTELYAHFIGKKTKGGEEEEQANEILDQLAVDDSEKRVGDEQVMDEEEEEGVSKEAALKGVQAAMDKHQSKITNFDKKAAEDKGKMNQQAFDESVSLANPTSMGDLEKLQQPKIFKGNLKPYQIKGMNWLVNLYNQGINGILADEMGLGKTVQTISVLAYLAEAMELWGPFLVVAPASTLHNWQQEFAKFVPSFKVLPYWGTQADRKILRKYWNPKNLYTKDAAFHVMITSYQIVVSDESYLKRMRFQYMALDEAQAIKSSSSARWNVLLGFNARNRLLLTGTPIQNSMQELWALLHFIMPSLFDSHDEFNEWFSKDIESHAEKNSGLDENQLRRLHMILKPFMLRRIKKDVENELMDKIEIELKCGLTARQKTLYQGLKNKISIEELFETAHGHNSANMDKQVSHLMNLVMQFRKVCNHPDLFERRDCKAPFQCQEAIWPPHGYARHTNHKESSAFPDVSCVNKSVLCVQIPKIVWNEFLHPAVSPANSVNCSMLAMSLFSAHYISRNMQSIPFLSGYSAGDVSRIFFGDLLTRIVVFCQKQSFSGGEYQEMTPIKTAALQMVSKSLLSDRLPFNSCMRQMTSVWKSISPTVLKLSGHYMPNAAAAPANVRCTVRGFENIVQSFMYCLSAHAKLILFGRRSISLPDYPIEKGLEGIPVQGVIGEAKPLKGWSLVTPANHGKTVSDAEKMRILDQLLPKLKAEGHRVLIYSQMTKMIDLLEDYMNLRRHKYMRLDGSSKISERRDMVADFQNRNDIFAFLLSTRAGGLGINLTAADTVIFYDSDWNPTVDQQAMDRAHRLGQTRQVTVYRLITKSSIEERILQRAKQKSEIHKMVITGGGYKAEKNEALKANEVVTLLLDDDELEAQMKRKEEEAQKKQQAAKEKEERSKRKNEDKEARRERRQQRAAEKLALKAKKKEEKEARKLEREARKAEAVKKREMKAQEKAQKAEKTTKRTAVGASAEEVDNEAPSGELANQPKKGPSRKGSKKNTPASSATASKNTSPVKKKD
eukprot:Nk52_evm87s914 gene=Nk52_evmTU87s914